MNQQEIEEKVSECLADALGLDLDEVEMDASVMEELGAESLDLLDIAYRLERAFGVKIPRGDLEKRTQEAVGSEVYEVDGVLTERALSELRAAMPEVPADRIKEGLTTRDIPGLFTPRTFVNLVMRLLAEKAGAAGA